jgi:Zn-dependent peptidase ImmA (M78 family)
MTHTDKSIIRDLRSVRPMRPYADKNEAFAVAEEQASELLKFLGITEPEVDVSLITQLPRIEVQVDADLPDYGLYGMTTWEHGRWLIKISKGARVASRRFTLAHEFKHILDDPTVKSAYSKLGIDEYDRKAIIEEVCEYFADSFLMPRLLVTRAVRADVRNVARLAALFGVLQSDMDRRLQDLGLKIELPEGEDPIRSYFRTATVRRRGHRPKPAPNGGIAALQTLMVNSEIIYSGRRNFQRLVGHLIEDRRRELGRA